MKEKVGLLFSYLGWYHFRFLVRDVSWNYFYPLFVSGNKMLECADQDSKKNYEKN